MAKVRRFNGDFYTIICPGCGEEHKIGSSWKFNGDFDRPTFFPSLLVRCGHYANPTLPCWCTHNADKQARGEEPSGFECYQCHSFITDGKIQFLGDCTHALAGETVELPNFEI